MIIQHPARCVLSMFVSCLFLGSFSRDSLSGPTPVVLQNFSGVDPHSALLMDSAGNLYGTTQFGG